MCIRDRVGVDGGCSLFLEAVVVVALTLKVVVACRPAGVNQKMIILGSDQLHHQTLPRRNQVKQFEPNNDDYLWKPHAYLSLILYLIKNSNYLFTFFNSNDKFFLCSSESPSVAQNHFSSWREKQRLKTKLNFLLLNKGKVAKQTR